MIKKDEQALFTFCFCFDVSQPSILFIDILYIATDILYIATIDCSLPYLLALFWQTTLALRHSLRYNFLNSCRNTTFKTTSSWPNKKSQS